MSDGTSSTIRHAVCATLLGGLCAGLFAAAIGRPVKPIDDWRRTAHGWERTMTWARAHRDAAILSFKQASDKQARLDTHPAALALFQLTAAMLALALFGPRGRTLLRKTPIFELLVRSFRASAFGS
jgi:hypothetical protein